MPVAGNTPYIVVTAIGMSRGLPALPETECVQCHDLFDRTSCRLRKLECPCGAEFFFAKGIELLVTKSVG